MPRRLSQAAIRLWVELSSGAVVVGSRQGGVRAIVIYNDDTTPPRCIKAATLQPLRERGCLRSELAGRDLVVYSYALAPEVSPNGGGAPWPRPVRRRPEGVGTCCKHLPVE
jgi:hypothetical protein